MVKLKYRNNEFVSNRWICNILRCYNIESLADISYQKPNITRGRDLLSIRNSSKFVICSKISP
jgi:hypothetical protein